MDKVAYLGPEGSYSHLAAMQMCPNAELCPYSSFYLAVSSLKHEICNLAVLPIENSINGAVLANIDLLQTAENVIAVEKRNLAIDHRLATFKGADPQCILRIFSHEQPLAQCSEFIEENYPTAQLIATPSTAASLFMMKCETDAAIVGSHIKREGIELSPRNIADSPNNFTQFLLVKKGQANTAVHSEFIYFSVTCKHASGALLDILQPMREGGMNMTKIQSRPIKDKPGEYRFFIEAEGDYSSVQVRKVLDGVSKIATSLKILGVY